MIQLSELTLQDLKERLVAFADDVHAIPDNFSISCEYLNGLDSADFVKAFAHYRDILVNMYRHAALDPQAYGFSSLNRKTGEEKLYIEFSSPLTFREKLAQVHLLLNKLCDASELVDGSLVVNVPKLTEVLKGLPKVRDTDKLMRRLQEQGFVFSGYTGRLSRTQTLSVSYPPSPHLISVIKSYSQSKYAKTGMEYDFAHMNHRLLARGPSETLPTTDLFVYHSLIDEAQVFLLEFNAAMNRTGYYYGDGPISGLCWGISQFAYSKAPEKKKDFVCRLYQRANTLVVRLYLKNIDAYGDYIESAPGVIRDMFTSDFGNCKGCRPECKHRKRYTIAQASYCKCDGLVFEFDSIQPESIPCYIELLRLSARSR